MAANRLVAHRPRAALLTLIVLAAVATAFPARALGSVELQNKMKAFAQDVKQILDDRGEAKVAIGPNAFTGPAKLATAGPGIAKALRDELKKLRIAVGTDAGLSVSGKFRDVNDADTDKLAVELKVKVVDRKTKRTLKETAYGIFGPTEIALLTGANTQMPVSADSEEQIDQLERDLNKPRAVVKGARVYSAPKGKYAVEVRVNEAPRQAKLKGGQPFVPIDRGEIFTLRLYNDTDIEAAILVVIDGINIFAFNEDPEPDGVEREYRVIVPKRGTAKVKGWYRSKGISDSFQVTDYAKSAAGMLKSTEKVGTITAVVSACWDKGGTPPPGEKTRSATGTGFGPPVKNRYQRVERDIGAPREVITIRYTRD
jgi:hypothetical protein